MRPFIKKLGHLGIAAVFGLSVIVGLSTCGGKQKRQPGSLPDEQAAPAEGSAAKGVGEATQGEAGDVLGTNPTVNYGDDRGVAGHENFSIFQLGSLGTRYSYDGSSQVSNLDVAAVSSLTSPREVIEKASECKSPGHIILNEPVVAVCVGETKVLWAPAGDQDFVIKADSEMAITVLSKPQLLSSFVGTRDSSEKFSGSMSAVSGDTLVFLGKRSADDVVAAGSSGAGAGAPVPPDTADPGFVGGVSGSGSTTVSGSPSAPVSNTGSPTVNIPPAGPGSGGSGAVAPPPGVSNEAAAEIRKAETIGYYLADSSLIAEFDNNGGASLERRGFEFVPADGHRSLEFLKGGTLISSTKWDGCDKLKVGNVVGIKVYHLFVEAPAAANCETKQGIEITFPPLALAQPSSQSGTPLPLIIDQPIAVKAQNDGRMTMGIDGWTEVSDYTPGHSSLDAQKYEQVDTSLELIIAPALLDMKNGASIYVAHLFVALPKHDADSNDMKNKPWSISPNIALGVFSLKDGSLSVGPPFHTVTIQPHLAQLSMERKDVKGAWMAGSSKSGTIKPLLFASSNVPVPEVALNRMSEHAGWCGFDVIFAAVGNTTDEFAIALKTDLTQQKMPYMNRFYVDTLLDLKSMQYAKHESATACMEEDLVDLYDVEADLPGIQNFEKVFDPIAGPKLVFDIRAKLKKK